MAGVLSGFVLVHSSFHTPEHFAGIAYELHSLGFAVEVPRLPSITLQSDPGDGLARDAAAIEGAIWKLTTKGKDVVVHMHGYGGVPGSEAVAAVCEAQRALGPASKHGRIKRLVYLSSHTLLQGETLIEEYRKSPINRPTELLPGNLIRYKTPMESFYNTTPLGIASAAASRTTPMLLSPFGTAPTYCGWRDYGISVLYIICTLDNANPKAAQERMVARMQLLGADVRVRRIESDHSPYLCRPREYLAILQQEATRETPPRQDGFGFEDYLNI